MKLLFITKLVVLLTTIVHNLYSQDCQSKISITLKNIYGGVYANQQVTLTNKADRKTYANKSNGSGVAIIAVPCNGIFEIAISNFTKKAEISSDGEGSTVMQTFEYEPNMAAKDKLFEMSASEKLALDNYIKTVPDSIFMNNAVMAKPKNPTYFTELTITISDIENKPLIEQLTIVGEKRHKKIIGTTDKNGRILIYLPKGDDYYINFKYNINYMLKSIAYERGSAQSEMSFSYLGTKEIEKRKKAEAERIALEEKRLKAEAEAFAKECKMRKISVEEGRKREAAGTFYPRSRVSVDTVVSAVLNRNKWTEKLIVCDLTGSMSPYAAQLSAWYQMSYLKEKNLQFVFFNDGDNKSDYQKKIGETGGIYYSPSKGIDSLYKIIVKVSMAGGGGDCPENNMEALIKGVKMAKPYKELVMIADNNAPIKDIELLSKFKAPVHIILYGVNNFILEDYLTLAWKTKGSVHTMEEDITKLASMLEGQEITVGRNIYRIMGGAFVIITKT